MVPPKRRYLSTKLEIVMYRRTENYQMLTLDITGYQAVLRRARFSEFQYHLVRRKSDASVVYISTIFRLEK
jgi:hypothetical protein